MEEKRRKINKRLVAKILIGFAIALFLALFVVCIVQTVRVNNLNRELEKAKQSFQSEAVEA